MIGCRSTQLSSTKENVDKEDKIVKDIFLPSDTSDNVYAGLNRREQVLQFYQFTDHKSVWTKNQRPLPIADSMLLFVDHIRYHGLLRSHYHASEIEVRRNALANQHNLARLDVVLTDAFFTIANDLKYGRLRTMPGAVDDSLNTVLLQQVLVRNSVTRELVSQEPQFDGYQSLKKALQMLLDSLDDTNRNMLLKGYSYKSIAAQDQVQRIEINLERWRWESDSFGKRYILVNIPSFILRVVSNQSNVFECKVIVGKPETPTPNVSSIIEYFVIYPYWSVPRKIAVDEYLPVIQRDTSFINRNNFEVLNNKGKRLLTDSIPWSKFSRNYFPVTLRQREGPDNSLGVLKFVFDNPYAVYLHDTNAKHLFNSGYRAFSHGCIRMEKATELAHYLVTGSVNKRSSVIDGYLNRKKRYTMKLPSRIPIYVRYFTCEFRNNVFFQYNDIYGLDKKLIDQLYK